MQLDGCTALITGASAGIGAEFARQLAGRVGALVLVARRLERLEQLRAELTRANPGLHVHVRAIDLGLPEQISALAEWLEDEDIDVDLLINNAGLGDHGLFATSDADRVRAMIEVNITAVTMLTHRLLPSMIERKCGAVLNVSSSASFLPIPRMAEYAATKAYVTSLSEALRMELGGTGIRVQALCPGPVETEFNTVAKRADEPSRKAPDLTYVPVEQVVREALAGLEHDHAIVIPGLVMKIAMALVRLTPMPLLRLASRLS